MNRGSYAGGGAGGNLMAGGSFWPLLGVPAGDTGTDRAAEEGEKDEHQASAQGANRNEEYEALGRLKMLDEFLDRLLKLRVGVLDNFVHRGERRLSKFLPLVREQNFHCCENAQDKKPEQTRNRTEEGP